MDRPPRGRSAARDRPGERAGILSLLPSCCEMWTLSSHLSEPSPHPQSENQNDNAKKKKKCLTFCQANRQQARGGSCPISSKNIKKVINHLMGHSL